MGEQVRKAPLLYCQTMVANARPVAVSQAELPPSASGWLALGPARLIVVSSSSEVFGE